MTKVPRKEKEKLKAERKKGPMDLPFFLLVVLLASIGLIMMFSASYAAAYYFQGDSTHFLVKQAGFSLAGVALMLIISRMNYQYFRVFSIPAMVVALILLILVPFIGRRINGATRWIYIGPISVQPSEIAKVAVIMCFASMISVFKEKMKTFKYGVLPFVLILGVIAGLMMLQPHLSGMILIIAVGAVMLFAGGVHWAWFAGAGAAGVGGIWFVLNNMAHSVARLRIWFDPWIDPRGDGFQIIQSLYAVGSGGFLGLGIGKSRQKYLYLPEQHNDFVFAIVCEELGMVGALLIMSMFALVIIRGYWIAIKSRDRFGSLLVTGITTLLAIQTFLNIAVVTNLIPTTGVSLPFFSYGGSSLLIQFVEMGIILSVSRQIPAQRAG